MKKLCLFAFILFTITACQDDDDATFVCNDFRVGDSISVPIPDGDAFLRFDGVHIENRCPCNADCITVGGTGFRLISPANDTLLIGTGGDGTTPPDTVRYRGQLLRLVNISHRQVCTFTDLEPADYCAEFRFE